jgi:hypothetical protein
MADPTFLSETKICFGDLEIRLSTGDAAAQPLAGDDVFYMEKSRPYVDAYRRIRENLGGQARNVLEVGIFRGGSAPFLHRFFDARRVICVDRVSGPVTPLERYQRDHAPGVFSIRYGVDQANRARLAEVLDSDLSEPLDLVVDDASHWFEQTKTTFETVLPYLRPGAIYAIEDWSWAHTVEAQTPDHYWSDQPALTNLCFELVVAYAAGSGLISGLTFAPGIMWIQRGWLGIPKGTFRLIDYTPMRGRQLGRI